MLKIESLTVGTESKTSAIIVYIEGKVPVDLIDLIRNKIINLKIDFIIDTNSIEEELL